MNVELDWTGGISFTAKARQFTLKLDEPADFNGTDMGPSPAEYFATSIGGCLGTSFAYCLKNMEVPAKAIKISVNLDMHHSGENRNSPLRITGVSAAIDVTLVNPDDEEILDLCIESFNKYCVVSQSIMAGVPIDVKISKI
jgi:uncharacterized OsmC-like protein